MNNKITIKDILKFSNYTDNNIIFVTNGLLYSEENIFEIKENIFSDNKIMIVTGRLLNNTYMVHKVLEQLNEDPSIGIVIWNRSEDFTEQGQLALRELLDTNIQKIKFIFITKDLSKIDPRLKVRCIIYNFR